MASVTNYKRGCFLPGYRRYIKNMGGYNVLESTPVQLNLSAKGRIEDIQIHKENDHYRIQQKIMERGDLRYFFLLMKQAKDLKIEDLPKKFAKENLQNVIYKLESLIELKKKKRETTKKENTRTDCMKIALPLIGTLGAFFFSYIS